MSIILREIVIALIAIGQYILGMAVSLTAYTSESWYEKLILFPFMLMISYPFFKSAERFWKKIFK